LEKLPDAGEAEETLLESPGGRVAGASNLHLVAGPHEGSLERIRFTGGGNSGSPAMASGEGLKNTKVRVAVCPKRWNQLWPTPNTWCQSMTKLDLAKRIAAIVVYGHLVLFAFGLVVMLIGPYNTADTAQMILMGSPLLAMVGISAYRFMGNLPKQDTSEVADPSWSLMSTITTGSFIAALFAVYVLASVNTSISSTVLKFLVGAIETVLGGYLGVNRDLMFPDSKNP
jgi:hypothetical protein